MSRESTRPLPVGGVTAVSDGTTKSRSEQGIRLEEPLWKSEPEVALFGVAVSHSLEAKRWFGTKNVIKSISGRTDAFAVKSCFTALFADMVEMRFSWQIYEIIMEFGFRISEFGVMSYELGVKMQNYPFHIVLCTY